MPSEAATLAPRALYQQVAERLREQIFNRELEPGSWIDELKLAQEYGISRTPLREALKVLAVEGLVTMKVRRGAYVTEMSTADVHQVYRLLALLESDAAAEVAELEPLKRWANPQDVGEIKDAAQVESLRAFLAARSTTEPQVTRDDTSKQTMVKMKGDILVKLVNLQHY